MNRGGAATEPRAELGAAAALFRGLADPTRLAIMRRLAVGQARVVDLSTELHLAQSTVSSHLACLRECGLTDSRPEGRSSWYFLARPELMDLLAAAEGLLAATGESVELCPNYGRAAAGNESEGLRNG
ncbi:ArsR/SmtB family transcription factor [Streptomyces sp. ActVer]|uniref:ArsR/SmtB family transcription factor n=1 Tax=Streptomyces sp. ActVer TaxID=3014558 RepID=UPI0034DDC57C